MCVAQVVAEFGGPNGKFIAGLELGKTSDIGLFDDYVGPIVSREIRSFFHLSGQHKGSSGNYANINRVADYMNHSSGGLNLKYTGILGLNFIIGYEFNDVLEKDGGGFRVSFYNYLDRNTVKAYAPQGIGILTDPTAFKADVLVRNIGFNLEAPVFSYNSASYAHLSYFGVGLVQNRTVSRGIAKSDFLDIAITETRILDRPVFSYAYRLRPLPVEGASPYGFDLQAQIFHTQKMYNVILGASIVRSFY